MSKSSLKIVAGVTVVLAGLFSSKAFAEPVKSQQQSKETDLNSLMLLIANEESMLTKQTEDSESLIQAKLQEEQRKLEEQQKAEELLKKQKELSNYSPEVNSEVNANKDLEHTDLRYFNMPTEEQLRDYILTLTKGVESPLIGYESEIIRLSDEYRINPAYVIAITYAECGIGTNKSGVYGRTGNLFSMGAGNFTSPDKVPKFKTPDESLSDFYEKYTSKWYKHGQYTIHDVEYAYLEGKEDAWFPYSVVADTQLDNSEFEADLDYSFKGNDNHVYYPNITWIKSITKAMSKATW